MKKLPGLLLIVSIICNVSLAASALDAANAAHKWHDRYRETNDQLLDAQAERDGCKLVLDGIDPNHR